MECPPVLCEDMTEGMKEEEVLPLDAEDSLLQTDNANSLRHRRSCSPKLEDNYSNDFNKSIEFKDLIYAVFQGRGLRKYLVWFNSC